MPVAADESDEPDYRAQILGLDVASVALALAGGQTGARIGLLTYLLGPPIVHGAHEQGTRAAVSLVLRVVLPVASAIAWGEVSIVNAHCGPDDYDCGDGTDAAILGLGLGIATAMVLDETLLGPPAKVRRTAGATWRPQVAVTPQHVGLGVLGRF